MRALVFLVKLLLKIAVAPVIVALTLFVWICVGIVYISGLVLGLISMVVALLGVAVLITYHPAGHGVSHQPLRFAYGGILAAGQGAGFEVCDSRFGLRIRGDSMGKSNKICPSCGRKMKCQFSGLQHFDTPHG